MAPADRWVFENSDKKANNYAQLKAAVRFGSIDRDHSIPDAFASNGGGGALGVNQNGSKDDEPNGTTSALPASSRAVVEVTQKAVSILVPLRQTAPPACHASVVAVRTVLVARALRTDTAS